MVNNKEDSGLIILNKIIEIWNNSTDEYKVLEKNNGVYVRRIYFKDLGKVVHYDFIYKTIRNKIAVRIHHGGYGDLLKGYVEKWKNEINIDGNKLSPSYKHVSEIKFDLDINNIDKIIFCMKQLVSQTEKDIEILKDEFMCHDHYYISNSSWIKEYRDSNFCFEKKS